MKTAGEPYDARPILLVESNFHCSVVISRVFRDLQLLDSLIICVDCENALTRLHRSGRAKPSLILLDLDMPRMSAQSFLKAVKGDPRLQTVPVIILAETNDAEKVAECYGLGAAGYMVRPDDYAELHRRMTAVCSYWSLSRLPAAD